MARDFKCPFSPTSQLIDDSDSTSQIWPGSLPGHPLIPLDAPPQLGAFLEAELCCDDLETMAPNLWMMSTQSSASVQALHHHRLLGREILITERPSLHLVWYYNRVFIKPLPRYLLSHKFWMTYLFRDSSGGGDNDSGASLPSPDCPLGNVTGRADKVRRAALGLVRTYRHLIRHESDFNIALAVGLVPASTTWPRFCAFVSRFDDAISDADVSGRYHYGDLRLTRLNFYCKFFLHRAEFEYLPTQYSSYFRRYFGPLFFVFAVLSVVLSAMQLEVAVQETTSTELFGTAWAAYRWFSVAVMLGALSVSGFLIAHVLYMIANEWAFALRARWKRLRADRRAAAQE